MFSNKKSFRPASLNVLHGFGTLLRTVSVDLTGISLNFAKLMPVEMPAVNRSSTSISAGM